MMKMGLPMVVLAVLALVGLAEGRIVSKCELRDLVDFVASLEELPKRVTVDDLVAKIVCHAELGSGFNTTQVTEVLVPEKGPNPTRHRKKVKPRKGRFGMASFMGASSSFMEGSGSSEEESESSESNESNVSNESNESSKEDNVVWMLYGLFQLSDHVACVSGRIPTLNLCKMDCNDLINDDITDDIVCVQTIMQSMMMKGQGRGEILIKKMVSLLYQPECAQVSASDYFDECM